MFKQQKQSKIKDLDSMPPGKSVLIRGRTIRVYYDATGLRAYLTVADDSGVILSKVQNAVSQTILVGAIVNVRGKTAIHKGKIYLKTNEVTKIQDVEEGYSQLADISVPKEDEISSFEEKRWVKLWKGKPLTLKSVSFQEVRRLEWVITGIMVFFLGFFVPIEVSAPILVGGIGLIIFGLYSKHARVTGIEVLEPKPSMSTS
jgi:hypothetical protein